jgi:hypothetical protein
MPAAALVMHMSTLLPVSPDGRPRRLSSSWLVRKLRAMIAPFKPLSGGPLLDDCTHQHVDCGSVDIDFFLPRAYFGTGSRPSRIDLEDEKSFSGRASKERAEHAYAKIGGSNWSYYSPFWDINRLLPIPQDPYVIITAIWQIERVKRGLTLEVGDMAGLEHYLRQDYDMFVDGMNLELREINRKDYEKFYSLETEESQDFFENHVIKPQLRSPPEAYETLLFNGVPWLRYAWNEQPGRSLPTAFNYSRTLSDRSILTVYFDITYMSSGGGKDYARWRKTFLRDSEALMGGLTITPKCLPPP